MHCKSAPVGRLLFHELLVWVGAPQFQLWRPRPAADRVYEETSLSRRRTVKALAQQSASAAGPRNLLDPDPSGCVLRLRFVGSSNLKGI